MADNLRILGFAAASGSVGHVLVRGNAALDWGISRKASRSPADARAYAEDLVRQLLPDVVVNEHVAKRSRKAARTRRIVAALASVAAGADLLDVTVLRKQAYQNRFVEAAALGDLYTELRAHVPRPKKLWESEPRSIAYFHALSLIEGARRGSEQLRRHPGA